MPKTLHYAYDDDYNDPEGCIYTFRRTFLKESIGYMTRTFPKGPVSYTISTDDIIPPKRKSCLWMTITKYPRQINKTEYIN